MKERTIALNMIVGAGDGDCLERCLLSFYQDSIFSEIIIVATTNDTRVIEVAEKYATKVIHREWTTEKYPYGDFAGARNAAYDVSESDWVMWLDADDVLHSDDIKKKLLNLKKSLSLNYDQIDVYLFDYILNTDKDGVVTDSIIRERIWKKALRIKWKYPCHEQLGFNWNVHRKAQIKGLDIVHKPIKYGTTGIQRNIDILTNEYRNPKTRNAHNSFYLARDLALIGRSKEAIPVLTALIYSFKGSLDNIFEAAMSLTKFYLYDNGVTVSTEFIDLATWFCNIALSVCNSLSETHVYRGDIYNVNKNYEKAIENYKTAMIQPVKEGYLQQVAYCEAIPSERLSNIYTLLGKIEQALYYNSLALIYFIDNKALLDCKSDLLKILCSDHIKKIPEFSECISVLVKK